MAQVQLIKIFVSCPSDIKEELNSLRLIIAEINKTSGRQSNFMLELLNWKEDVYTEVGSDVQQVINNQIESQYDILVGIIWQRIGTPTKREASGTVEEIKRAMSRQDKELLVFFKTTSPDNINLIDTAQLSKVFEFKAELANSGLLYKEFNETQQFESLFRINLTNLILENFLNKRTLLPEIVVGDKYEEISNLIAKIENRSEIIDDIDVIETTDKLVSVLGDMTSSMNSIRAHVNQLTSKITKSNNDLKLINHIKDEKLRQTKIKPVYKLLAEGLDEFTLGLNHDTRKFSESFLLMSETYSSLLLGIGDYESDEFDSMKQQAIGFKDSLEGLLLQSADSLKAFLKLPPVNFKFNNSKREAEVAIKDLVKSLMEAIKMFDDIVK